MGWLHPCHGPTCRPLLAPSACCPQGKGGDHLALRCRIMDFIRDREEEYRFFM